MEVAVSCPTHGILFCTTAEERTGSIVLDEELQMCNHDGCSEATMPLTADQVTDPDTIVNLADMRLEDANSRISASDLYEGIVKRFGSEITDTAKVAIARGIVDFANTV